MVLAWSLVGAAETNTLTGFKLEQYYGYSDSQGTFCSCENSSLGKLEVFPVPTAAY